MADPKRSGKPSGCVRAEFECERSDLQLSTYSYPSCTASAGVSPEYTPGTMQVLTESYQCIRPASCMFCVTVSCKESGQRKCEDLGAFCEEGNFWLAFDCVPGNRVAVLSLVRKGSWHPAEATP